MSSWIECHNEIDLPNIGNKPNNPNLGLSWTTLYENSYCDGEFGYDRMGLAGDDVEECRESATLDSYCSNTLYYCSPNSGFQCRCVMKDRQCKKDTVFSYSCTVERKSRFRRYTRLLNYV